MIKPIKFSEHEIKSKQADELKQLIELETSKAISFESSRSNNKCSPKYLGIESTSDSYIAGYYIGASWLKENEISAVVTPKVPNIDYIEMFSAALYVNSEKESEYFSNYYGIEFDKPTIKVDESFNIITPLIMIHFISVLTRLVKHGLKRGYIYKEDNLQSKVKGHFLFHRHMLKNIIGKREDRAYCGFQEYTIDIPENRILKKALVFVNLAINNYRSLRKHQIYNSIRLSVNKLLSAFVNVSESIEIHEVKSIKTSKLFSEYKEAVELAKTILKRFDYSLNNTKSQENITLPFWIDMPRLYEMYIYKWLKDNIADDEVLFQVEGYQGTAADFVLPKQGIILDAKYKPKYDNSNVGIIDDIREMSGYARDEAILKKIENHNSMFVPCVIVYPKVYEEMEKTEDEKSDRNDGFFSCNFKITKIRPYRDFYKLQVDVPIIKK